MGTKKVSPTPMDEEAKKLSQARESLFQAGFIAGVAYRSSPKYNPKDPLSLDKTFKACKDFYAILGEDEGEGANGAGVVQRVAELLGISTDELQK